MNIQMQSSNSILTQWAVLGSSLRTKVLSGTCSFFLLVVGALFSVLSYGTKNVGPVFIKSGGSILSFSIHTSSNLSHSFNPTCKLMTPKLESLLQTSLEIQSNIPIFLLDNLYLKCPRGKLKLSFPQLSSPSCSDSFSLNNTTIKHYFEFGISCKDFTQLIFSPSVPSLCFKSFSNPVYFTI